MKVIFLVLSMLMTCVCWAEVQCDAEQPYSGRTTAQVLEVKCGNNQFVYLRSREIVTHATVRGTDATGKTYSANIPVKCNGGPCSLTQVYNREFDQITAIYAYANQNGSVAVPPILRFDVDRVTFSDSAQPVRDLANLTPTGNTLAATLSGSGVINLPTRSGVPSAPASAPVTVTPPAVTPASTPQPPSPPRPSASTANVVANVAQPSRVVSSNSEAQWDSCSYVSFTGISRPKETDREVSIFEMPDTTGPASCRSRKVCSARVQCTRLEDLKFGTTFAFCNALDNNQCPEATACANARDFERDLATVPAPATSPAAATGREQ